MIERFCFNHKRVPDPLTKAQSFYSPTQLFFSLIPVDMNEIKETATVSKVMVGGSSSKLIPHFWQTFTDFRYQIFKLILYILDKWRQK